MGQEHKLLICFPQMGLPNIFAKDARFRSRKKLARARLETLQAAFAGTAWHAQLMALVEGLDWKRVRAVEVQAPQSAG